MTQILPDLYGNPMSMTAPEGVDAGPFNRLRMNLMQDKIVKDAASKERQAEKDSSVIGQMFSSNPERMSQLMPDVAKRLGLQTPELERRDPSADIPEEGVNLGPDLGVDSLEDVETRLFNKKLKEGYTPSKAAESAGDTIAALRRRTKELYGSKLKEEADKVAELEEVIRLGEEGISKAGETGSKAASAYEKALSSLAPWSTPEADAQAAGDALLAQVKQKGAMANRIAGTGTLSNNESQALFDTAMGPDKSKSQNQAILETYKQGLALTKEHQNFMNYFMDRTGGNPEKAQSLWELYKEAHPVIIKDKNGQSKINNNRTPWQKFDFKDAYGKYLKGEKPIPNVAEAPRSSQTVRGPDGNEYVFID
jgi:hypothetical protein